MGQELRINIPTVLEEGAELPRYQTPGAAGMDLHANEDIHLQPLERKMIGTGVSMAIPDGYEGQVRPRSGLAAKYGISMVNTPGTIDSDYRGEIKILMINFGETEVKLQRGERIAQLVICPVLRAQLVQVDSLDDTQRGEKGFGSTGK
jgi:dUTP pyrophosphatase